jgi:hypothetical protein
MNASLITNFPSGSEPGVSASVRALGLAGFFIARQCHRAKRGPNNEDGPMTDPKLVKIAEQIAELQKFTKATGNKTGKSQTALMAALDPVELSIVASLVNQKLSTPKDGPNGDTR